MTHFRERALSANESEKSEIADSMIECLKTYENSKEQESQSPKVDETELIHCPNLRTCK